MTFPPGPAEEGILTPLIANPNQYKFCLVSLYIPFLNSAQLDKGELLKEVHNAKKSYDFLHFRGFEWPRVCGGGLEVDKIVIRNPTLIFLLKICSKKSLFLPQELGQPPHPCVHGKLAKHPTTLFLFSLFLPSSTMIPSVFKRFRSRPISSFNSRISFALLSSFTTALHTICFALDKIRIRCFHKPVSLHLSAYRRVDKVSS